VFDIHFQRFGTDTLRSIEFAIKNKSIYAINNIKLFFVYKNYKGEVVSYSANSYKDSILPKLALQFTEWHTVDYFAGYESGKYMEGDVEIRILDYEIDRSESTSPADLLFKR